MAADALAPGQVNEVLSSHDTDYAHWTLQWLYNELRVTGLCEGNSPVNSPHKGPLTWKMFPLDDVIMECSCLHWECISTTCHISLPRNDKPAKCKHTTGLILGLRPASERWCYLWRPLSLTGCKPRISPVLNVPVHISLKQYSTSRTLTHCSLLIPNGITGFYTKGRPFVKSNLICPSDKLSWQPGCPVLNINIQGNFCISQGSGSSDNLPENLV